MRRMLVLLGLVVLILVVGAAPVFAQSGRVGFGEDITIVSDEVMDGDLLAFGGNVTIESGGIVRGNVVAFGGNVVVDGQVDGDVVAFGGNTTLGPGAEVSGQVTHLGGSVTRAESAFVGKGITGGAGFPTIRGLDWGRIPVLTFRGDRIGDILGYFGALVLLAVVALLVTALLPGSLRVAQVAVSRQPWVCLGIGLLTLIVGAPLGLLLIITICLAPVGAVLWLGLVAASLMGWVAVGDIVGTPVLRALGARGFTGPVGAIAGVALLYVLTLVPCLGFVIALAVTSVGLGAEVLTLFGTRMYGVPLRPPVAPLPAAPAPPQGPQQA